MPYIVESPPDLLIQGRNSPGSTVFEDYSGNDHAIIIGGVPVYSTDNIKFNSSAILLNTSVDRLSADDPSLALGTGDFSIDFWMYIPYSSSTSSMFIYTASGGSGVYWGFDLDGTSTYGRMKFNGPSGGVLGSTTQRVYYNKFEHICVSRKSGVIKMFINGYLRDTKADVSNYDGTLIRLGGVKVSFEEFRVTKGTPVWHDVNFTPPTQPYALSGQTGVWSVLLDMRSTDWVADVGLRSIEFFKGDVKREITLPTEYTTIGSNTADYAFDTSLSKIGEPTGNSYESLYSKGVITLQMNYEPLDFDKVIVNNYHDFGGVTAKGVGNFKLWSSTLENAVWNTSNNDIDQSAVGEKIFDGVLLEHIASDIEDPETIINTGDVTADAQLVAPMSSVFSITDVDLPLVDIDVDCGIEAPVSSVSGLTINSADVPFVLLIQSDENSISGNDSFFDVANNIPVITSGFVTHEDTPYAKFGKSAIRTSMISFSAIHPEEDPADQYIEAGPSNLLTPGTGDFTFDYWVYPIAQTEEMPPVIQFLGGTSNVYINQTQYSNHYLMFHRPSGLTLGFESTYFQRYTHNHVAIVKHDGVIKMYKNGVEIDSQVDDNNYDFDSIRIGNLYNFYEEIRFSKYARWTEAFTPDAAPFVFSEDLFIGGFNRPKEIINSVLLNSAPYKTFLNGQPWNNQCNFNNVLPAVFGTSVADGTLPVALERAIPVVVVNKAYLFGGETTYATDAPNHEYSKTFSNEVYESTIDASGNLGPWSISAAPAPALDIDRQTQIIQTYRRLYAIDGTLTGVTRTAETDGAGNIGPWEYIYDLFPEALHGLAGYAITVTKNRVYLFGGRIPSEIGYAYINGVYVAHINQDGTISPFTLSRMELRGERHEHLAVYTGKKVYIIGDGETLSYDVSDQGYIFPGRTLEGWTLGGIGYNYVSTKTDLYLVSATGVFHTPIDLNGEIVAPTVQFYMDNMFDQALIATENKIYYLGGHKSEYGTDGTFFWYDEYSFDEIWSSAFSGIEVDELTRTTIQEATPQPIIGYNYAPAVSMQSYFGYGAEIFGDYVSSIPVLESSVRYTEYVDFDIASPMPVVECTFATQIDAQIFAPLPILSFDAVRGPYNLAYLESKLPVVESSISNPVAIWTEFIAKRPKVEGQFQWQANIVSYPAIMKSVLSNPQAAPVTYNTKAPAINSTVSNPFVSNTTINSPRASLGSYVQRDELYTGQIITKVPSISSSMARESIGNVSINTKVPGLNGKLFFIPSIDVLINTPMCDIHSQVDVTSRILGMVKPLKPIVTSRLESECQVNVTFNPKKASLNSFIQESIHVNILSKTVILNAAVSVGIAINADIDAPISSISRSTIANPETQSDIAYDPSRLCNR